jgi:RNA polymerase sigma-70 factor (ECF subfamily)
MLLSSPATEPNGVPPADVPARAEEPRPTFARLYEDHFSFVWRSAFRLGAPEATVEDVVQETFVVVYRRLPEFEGRSSVKTWLFGIVVNVVRAHRRTLRAKHPHSLQPQAPTDLDTLTDPSSGPLEIASKAEAARVVDRILDELDDDKREVFVLAELEQLGAPEIASALGIPQNTVYSRLHLARKEFAAAAARHRARDGWRTR